MRTAAVIGLGLIGGSFARCCKADGLRVIGIDHNAEARQAAMSAGAADETHESPSAAAGADEIFIAVPVGVFDKIFTDLRGTISTKTAIFDGGSCKSAVMESARRHLGDLAGRFVPSHPIAGGEDSGFVASRADLFLGRWAILCPAESDDDAAKTVESAWQRAGAKTAHMTTQEHDAVFAAVSHLPHVLSFALVESIRERDDYEELLRYAAGGFRDFTRIASSHPEMWRDICLQNREQILSASADFRRQLEAFEQAMKTGDGESLRQKFSAARDLRRRWREVLET